MSAGEFSKHSKRSDGKQASCKPCQREAAAKWYAENRERARESVAKWRADNPEKVASGRSRRRARKAAVPHEPYSRSDIFAAYGGTCAYCDAPAEHLDHVVAISRGGADAAHNLLPACAPCNLAKGARSLAEWAGTFGAGA